MRKDCKNDDELKLKLFITSNFTGRSTDMYIAEYWMDQLFGTSYGDGSGDISHYLTDEVIDKLNHNRNVMLRIRDVVYRRQNEEITDVQLDEEAKIFGEKKPLPLTKTCLKCRKIKGFRNDLALLMSDILSHVRISDIVEM